MIVIASPLLAAAAAAVAGVLEDCSHLVSFLVAPVSEMPVHTATSEVCIFDVPTLIYFYYCASEDFQRSRSKVPFLSSDMPYMLPISLKACLNVNNHCTLTLAHAHHIQHIARQSHRPLHFAYSVNWIDNLDTADPNAF